MQTFSSSISTKSDQINSYRFWSGSSISHCFVREKEGMIEKHLTSRWLGSDQKE